MQWFVAKKIDSFVGPALSNLHVSSGKYYKGTMGVKILQKE